MIQDTVFIVTVALMLVVTGVFAYVATNATKVAADYAPVQKKSYGIRAVFFWSLLAICAVITTVTTLDLPYAATRGQIPDNAISVDVEGSQWYWKMGQTDFKVGDTVLFNVSASDVNHGLGIYNPDMRMLGQTQAMPGYTNSLQISLVEPGTYKMLCMEYCGLAHHVMVTEITVSE